jgi:DNA repair exonuclease SbcCD ATPase subunit
VLTQLRNRLENEKGRLRQVKDDKNAAIFSLVDLTSLKLTIEIAQISIQEVAQKTQAELQFFISDMVDAAISAVFPENSYNFKCEFVQRRGKTEADLFLADAKGNRIKPSDAEGGGLVDIVSFALRICLWSLTKSSRATFFLDEGLKFLSRDLLPKAGELVKELSTRLGLQIIMVSHLDELIDMADRVIEVKKVKGVSNVRIVR